MKFFSIVFLSILVSTATAKNFAWDCTKSVGTCQNYCYAAKCGGMRGKKFKYDANKKVRERRRKLSGCSKNPCNDKKLSFGKFGNSCDEFPFASVREGGKNAHLRCVKKSENSSEGGQLRAFYRKLKNGERFGITIKNYSKAPLCTKRRCKNDGGQFKMNNKGKFVKGKRDLNATETDIDIDEFVDVEDFEEGELQEAHPLRQLETEDGELHLVIADDEDDPISVGHEIWNEDKKATVKVIREIFD